MNAPQKHTLQIMMNYNILAKNIFHANIVHILVLYQSSAFINNIAKRQMAEKGNE